MRVLAGERASFAQKWEMVTASGSGRSTTKRGAAAPDKPVSRGSIRSAARGRRARSPSWLPDSLFSSKVLFGLCSALLVVGVACEVDSTTVDRAIFLELASGAKCVAKDTVTKCQLVPLLGSEVGMGMQTGDNFCEPIALTTNPGTVAQERCAELISTRTALLYAHQPADCDPLQASPQPADPCPWSLPCSKTLTTTCSV